jgi:hypothetical protein
MAPREEQKGYREKLLWVACEALFSKYESAAKQLVFSLNDGTYHGLEVTRLPNRILGMGGVEYPKLKYFLLSVLWRTSISGSERFSGYKIPDQELIRSYLASEAMIPETFYPALLSRATFRGKPLGVFMTYK